LDRYMLTVKNLPEGRYDLVVDDRPVSTYTSHDLAAGVNIFSAAVDWWQPGGPWAAQAMLLKMITDARHELATARSLAPDFITRNPNLDKLLRDSDQINTQIEALQPTLVKPVPYRFVIKPAPPPATAAK